LLHQHQTTEKMKATTILTAALLTLQAGFLFASNNNTVVPGTRESSAVSYSFLAPVTPAEATFEETAMFTELSALAPVAPAEATFEDAGASVISTRGFAPVVAAEAAFEDEPFRSDLAPTIPAEADFE
jgi:hypothetical protein